ncbi:hypothetical protein D9615_002462 [Tricholomella constricta]|uniref:ML-like domain-containing protein n=1 Tax=Tricholomella constricta TaxID=117010 RepID=A0A8H5HMX9_9AGAR|nr:hypothetical protein D9615_002462 [Tricholomella constricta]
MLFSLARLRAVVLSFLLFTSFAFSKEQSLFTSSVTYCEPPETLLIQQFDIAYFAKNQSISFNVSAASVQANVNVTANLLLNVYGIHAVNITLDLCNILGGALCPLPMYNFTGSDSISLPESLGIQDKIPDIAFNIPDLEGVAQLVLTEVGTGNVKACVQATLSNGWSTHQTSVEWITGGIALATLLVSMWQSLSAEAILPFRLIDLLFLYQTIASTSFLSLNYPSTYRAFTLNFAWAMALFSTSPSSSLQPSIDRMRHLTGGNLANATSSSAVSLVNRKLSPYNFLATNTEVSLPFSPRAADTLDFTVLTRLAFTNNTTLRSGLALHSATQGGAVQTVTASSSNVLQAGIPIYVNSLHIATANAFMTVFLCSLILIACVLGVFLFGLALVFILGVFRRQEEDRKARLKSAYLSFIRAWGIRLALSLVLPITIFSFYQWTLEDSWLSVLLSVISLLILLIAVLYPTFLVLRNARRDGIEALYDNAQHLASNGPLYGQYRTPRFYFFLPLLVSSFLKAVFIAFVKGNGEAQVILMVILEGFTVISYLVLRPCQTRGGDIFSTFLAIIRLVCSGLLIAFVERLNVAPIPRVVIGLVLLVIFSVAVLITYINLVINSGIGGLWKCGRSGASELSGSSNVSMLEKGGRILPSDSNSSELMGRPNNPTPDGSDYLDPPFLHPFPVSPTETELNSVYTSNRTSTTMTVGSLLPRRWSFSPLNSPTGSSQVHEPTSSYNSNSNQGLSRASDAPPSLPHGKTRTVT